MASKVLHIITDLDCGGAEKMLIRLCSRTDQGSVVVLSIKPLGSLARELEQIGVLVHSLEVSNPISLIFSIFRLRTLLADISPKLIWGWMYHGALLATISAWFTASPVVWNFRQTTFGIKQEKVLTRLVIYLLRLLKSKPKLLVYNSASSESQHRNMGFSCDSRIIYNGFSDAEFYFSEEVRKAARETYGVSSRSFVIGHAARRHPMKGHESFFNSLIPVMSQYPDVHVLCSGHAVAADMLPKSFPKDRVTFLGVETEMNHFYNAIDLFCMSSAWGESFPNVLGEALLVGVYCVATDVGEASTILADEGTIVPTSNTKELTRAIVNALEHTTNTREQRERRRVSIQSRYSLDHIARRYQEIETEVIN